MPLLFTKAHAYGNDFLYVPADVIPEATDLPALARAMCDRHAGVGADGLVVYTLTPDGAAMRLFNADGSGAEVSGNGVRGLAALVARTRQEQQVPIAGLEVAVDTDAGRKTLALVEHGGRRFTFEADMGEPGHLVREPIEVAGEVVPAVILSMGNPQCVVLADRLDEERLSRLGRALQHHPRFPDGVNLELATVDSPEVVRILIWERGVGPTSSSGTGTCAAAVAAITYGGAARSLRVIAPGGEQHVRWSPGSGVRLTGWAEVVFDGRWPDP